MFTYKRLPFIVYSTPTKCLRTIEGVLQGIPHVAVYRDDILVNGATKESHRKTLDEVLTKLEDAALKFKKKQMQKFNI